MNIQIDSREKPKAIRDIIKCFEQNAVTYCVSKLFVGDYMSLDNPRLIIDRKQNLSEVYGNLCQQHKRFCAELTRARDMGIQIVILVEHGKGVRNIADVQNWVNPRLKETPYAWDGERLCKTMLTVAAHYGVRWEFCEKRDTGQRIIEILGG